MRGLPYVISNQASTDKTSYGELSLFTSNFLAEQNSLYFFLPDNTEYYAPSLKEIAKHVFHVCGLLLIY